jgi:hypothetical protein
MNDLEQMLSDTITTAIEGGIGYWSATLSYDWSEDGSEPTTATIENEDDRGVFHLNIHGIAAAMYRIAHDRDLNVNGNTLGAVSHALLRPLEADLDADDADIIVQVLLFGQIVYG